MRRPDSELYRGIRLSGATDWAERGHVELTGTERDFLDASRTQAEHERLQAEKRLAEQERSNKRLRSALGRFRLALVGVAALLVVGGVAVGLLRETRIPFLQGDEMCTATVGSRAVDLSVEQAENAALIAAVAQRRDLPPRAVSIALATAYQESDLRNIDYGDRDSLGLFQQRPSQGWGTADQITDPTYSATAFFVGVQGKTLGLLDIDGWESLSIAEAAQAVQISAYPDAYAKWEQSARSWLAEL